MIPQYLSLSLIQLHVSSIDNRVTNHFVNLKVPSTAIFKTRRAPAAGWCVPGFLELLLSANVSMLACVYVSAPEAINN